MATRYWVGGAGTWDSSTTTNWSTTSGGAGGASVPTSADDVVINGSSDTGSGFRITFGATVVCNNFTVSGIDQNVELYRTIGNTTAWSVYGSFDVSNGTGTISNYNSGAFTITFKATTTGKTITLGTGLANLFNASAISFNGVGGEWTFTGGVIPTFYTVGLSAGSIVLASGYGFNCTISFTSTGSSTRALTLNGTSAITITGGGSAGTWNTSGSNFTLTCSSTSTITNNATSPVFTCNFSTGSYTYGQVLFSTITSLTMTFGSGTVEFGSLTLDTSYASTQGISSVSINGNFTVTDTFRAGTGSNPVGRIFIKSATIGTTVTIIDSTASWTLTDVDFRDITISGGSSKSGTRLGNCGGNSGITFPAAKTVYLSTSAGGPNWSASIWALTSGGSAAAENFPLAQDTVTIDSNTSSTEVTISNPWNIGSINTTKTSTFEYRYTSVTPINMYGSLTLQTSTTFRPNIVFAGRGTMVLTKGSGLMYGDINVDAVSGTLQLGSSYSTSSTVTLTSGTFNANNYNVTLGTFTNTGSTTRTLTMGSGTWTVYGDWNVSSTGLTFNANTSTFEILLNGDATFAGGGLTYNNLNISGSASSTLTFTGSNTFSTMSSTRTGACTIKFAAGSTTTVTTWTIKGSSGAVVTLNSDIAGSQFTLTKAGGGTVFGLNYLNIKDSAATPSSTWYAGANSTNSGNNTGWTFTSVPTNGFFFMF